MFNRSQFHYLGWRFLYLHYRWQREESIQYLAPLIVHQLELTSEQKNIYWTTFEPFRAKWEKEGTLPDDATLREMSEKVMAMEELTYNFSEGSIREFIRLIKYCYGEWSRASMGNPIPKIPWQGK